MELLKQYLGQRIEFDIVGDGRHLGFLTDAGLDIIVVQEESKFLYVPLHHVRQLTLDPKADSSGSAAARYLQAGGEQISYASVLSRAKGLFCEIYLEDPQSMFGSIADILDDYFLIVTPLNKSILIPSFHLKWMSPLESAGQPHAWSENKSFSVTPVKTNLSQTFAEQLKQQEGGLISINEGLKCNIVGLLNKLENDIVELTIPEGKKQYHHFDHIKNVCIRYNDPQS